MPHKILPGWLWLTPSVFMLVAALARGEAPKEAAAPKAQLSPNADLASWNGGRITVENLLAAAAVKLPIQRVRLATPEGRVAFLHELTRYDLLVAEAERRGYGAHPLVELAAREASIDALVALELTVRPSAIEPSAVAERYARDAAQYHRPEMRRASHILVSSADEARALITQLAGADRERFAIAARTKSKDQATVRQSGELGWFTHDGKGTDGGPVATLSPALVEAAFALKAPQSITSAPIAVDGGFSVLMLTGETKAFERPLAKVEKKIREALAGERTAQQVQELAAKLAESTKVETHPELLAAIRLDEPTHDIPQGFPASPEDPRAPPKLVAPDGY